jgi:hypothetical protein
MSVEGCNEKMAKEDLVDEGARFLKRRHPTGEESNAKLNSKIHDSSRIVQSRIILKVQGKRREKGRGVYEEKAGL